MYGPIGHGFGVLASVFGAIVWAVGVFFVIAILIALIILLARFLWIATKASQRYLELNGSPEPRMRAAASSTPAPAAAPTTTRPATAPTTPVTKRTTTPKPDPKV